MKNYLSLDYPDELKEAHLLGTLSYGDFGETPEIIRQATGGVSRLNMQMKIYFSENGAVVNEEVNGF